MRTTEAIDQVADEVLKLGPGEIEERLLGMDEQTLRAIIQELSFRSFKAKQEKERT